MVEATIKDFEKNDLPRLIKQELSAIYKMRIAEEFCKPEWQTVWDGTGLKATEAVRQMIIESAPLVLAHLLDDAMSGILQRMKNDFQNSGRMY